MLHLPGNQLSPRLRAASTSRASTPDHKRKLQRLVSTGRSSLPSQQSRLRRASRPTAKDAAGRGSSSERSSSSERPNESAADDPPSTEEGAAEERGQEGGAQAGHGTAADSEADPIAVSFELRLSGRSTSVGGDPAYQVGPRPPRAQSAAARPRASAAG